MQTDTMNPPGYAPDGIGIETRPRPKRPQKYRVLIFNDDFTPGDFVIATLMKVFTFGYEVALAVTIETHTKGVGSCGEFSRDVAETKVKEIVSLARSSSHPLLARIEPV
jgi:ATP-dependent Clp protease adaptor protein ClpS